MNWRPDPSDSIVLDRNQTDSGGAPDLGEHFVTSAVGVAYRVHGTGEPLVLFHGGAGSWTHWVRNIGPLGAHFKTIPIDAPGYGDSLTPDRSLTPDGYLALGRSRLRRHATPRPISSASGRGASASGIWSPATSATRRSWENRVAQSVGE